MENKPLSPLNAAALLKQYGLRADKSLGQNFLQDEAALQKIVSVAEIQTIDTVLEIGPGLGALTRHLAQAAQRVVAVELDERLLAALSEVLAPFANVQLIHADILKTPIDALINTPHYLVVANIPYYITSAVMRHLLEARAQPGRIVLTIQKEVAERICAQPGDLSLLALSVQVYGAPYIAAQIPAGAFFPVPNVDSAVICVNLYAEPRIAIPLLDDFFALAKAGFSQKRKTLRNSLSGGLRLSPSAAERLLAEAGIQSQRRAETLSLNEWKTLTDAYQNIKAA